MQVTAMELYEWAARQVGRDENAIDEFLDTISLAPTNPDWDYWCDPLNVSTFAATGMGGAHFGEFDARDGQRPVVLVSPGSPDRSCLILGASLHEFLCLGCRVGYGLLVELAIQPAEATKWIQNEQKPDSRSAKILRMLSSEFALNPWSDVGNRLFELQELYLDELEMPD